jgi:hypothetical protein
MEPRKAIDAHNGRLEAQMESWRALRPAVIDSHHFNEEQDSDPHKSEKLDPEPEPHLCEELDPDSH